jgi:hypothetical protein
MYAIQLGDYDPYPEWLKYFAKVDLEQAQSVWTIIRNHSEATVDDICGFSFDNKSFISAKKYFRYFIAGSMLNAPSIPHVDDGVGGGSSSESSDPLTSAVSTLSGMHTKSCVQHIIEYIRRPCAQLRTKKPMPNYPMQ